MNDESNDSGPEDFRRALERFADSAEGARNAFEQLARALEDLGRYLDDRYLDREAREIYAWHGCPFGESDDALDLWFEYEQYTTVN